MAEYKEISRLELAGLASLTFFFAMGFAGCSIIFPPLLLIMIPGIVVGPAAIIYIYRRAVKGPCPYCGISTGAHPSAFTCRNCRKRVLVVDGTFVRVPR